jgi:hypothetical protein
MSPRDAIAAQVHAVVCPQPAKAASVADIGDPPLMTLKRHLTERVVADDGITTSVGLLKARLRNIRSFMSR